MTRVTLHAFYFLFSVITLESSKINLFTFYAN